jgi:hypothetical protein
MMDHIDSLTFAGPVFFRIVRQWFHVDPLLAYDSLLMGATYERFEQFMQRGGVASLTVASEFFMRDDPVFKTLRTITAKLRELGVPYAVAGGMALVAHGYDRTTVDVDILVTPEGLARIHSELEGLGYVPPFTGSKHLRDTTTKVRIVFLTTGAFPGDGKPKPVAFPDPASASIEIDGIYFLQLPKLVELKTASGMTNPGRLKDLADVQELIRVLKLKPDFEQSLDPFVREKFHELWVAVSSDMDPASD